jgi:RNA-directed DNA polymerase
MTTPRPPFQFTLDLPIPGRGEAVREVEVIAATSEPENPASAAYLMEAICDSDNIKAALRAVVHNKGAPGVHGITVRQLPGLLKARWREIEDQLLQVATSHNRCVGCKSRTGRRDTRPRHSDRDRPCDSAGGAPAAPAVVDPTFSEHSYGFRPGRSAQQAVAQAQAYVTEGYRFVVDIDLAKFFDRS